MQDEDLPVIVEMLKKNDIRYVFLIVEHWELSRDLVEYFVKPDPLAFEMAAVNY